MSLQLPGKIPGASGHFMRTDILPYHRERTDAWTLDYGLSSRLNFMLFKDQFLPNSVTFLIKKNRLDRLQAQESFKCEETPRPKVEAIQPNRRQTKGIQEQGFKVSFQGTWGGPSSWLLVSYGTEHVPFVWCGKALQHWRAGVEIHLQPMGNPTPQQRDAQRRF